MCPDTSWGRGTALTVATSKPRAKQTRVAFILATNLTESAVWWLVWEVSIYRKLDPVNRKIKTEGVVHELLIARGLLEPHTFSTSLDISMPGNDRLRTPSVSHLLIISSHLFFQYEKQQNSELSFQESPWYWQEWILTFVRKCVSTSCRATLNTNGSFRSKLKFHKIHRLWAMVVHRTEWMESKRKIIDRSLFEMFDKSRVQTCRMWNNCEIIN